MLLRLTGRAFGLILLAVLGLSVLSACGGGTPAITKAVMAKDVSGDTKDPVGVTTDFPADQAVFHTVVTIANLPSGSKVKTVWTAVDVGSAAAPNTKITETELAVDGSRNVDFTLTPNSGQFPPGSYKADIYLNGTLNQTLQFTVGGGAGSSQPADATPTSGS